MSTEIATIKNSGRGNDDLDVTEFWGGNKNGVMLQLTQGFGVALDKPGFIQLTAKDVNALAEILNTWLKEREVHHAES